MREYDYFLFRQKMRRSLESLAKKDQRKFKDLLSRPKKEERYEPTPLEDFEF